MSEQENGSGGAAESNPGGTDQGNQAADHAQAGNEQVTPPVTVESVDHKSYKKAVTEAKSAKERARQLEQELAAERQRIFEKEEQELLRKKDLDGVIKHREERIKLLESQNSALQAEKAQKEKLIQESLKLSEFKKALSGQLEDQYTALVPLDRIVIDPDTLEVDPLSLKTLAQEFENKYGRVIVRNGPPTPPSTAPKPNGEVSSYDQWKKLGNAKKMAEALPKIIQAEKNRKQ